MGKVVGLIEFINGNEFSYQIEFVTETDIIEDVDSAPVLGVKTTLKSWQVIGQEKLVRMANGLFNGGFRADPVGLGKSVTAPIAALRKT